MQAYVLGPGEGAPVRNPVGGNLIFKLGSEQCGGATSVLETEAALTLETRDEEHSQVLIRELADAGYTVRRLR